MQRLIQEFYIESIIPGIREYINEHNKKAIIKSVVARAHKDVMVAARYKSTKSSKTYCDKHTKYQNKVEECLRESTIISGRKIVEKLHEGTEEINIGLIQKLVNMSVKYLYAIQNCGVVFGLYFNIDEERCDCPLDSKILKRLEKDKKNIFLG